MAAPRVWRFRRTSVTISAPYASAAWAQARYRPELYVTPAAVTLLAEDGEAVGVIRIAWRRPHPNLATVWKIEWDPAYIGESVMWDLLEELLGVAIEQRAA
jgi:RimJ/RimL family protein N-acetyltransferase